MNKEVLVEYLNKGLTYKEIGVKEEMSKQAVGYWVKKFELTNPNTATQDFLCRRCGTTTPKRFEKGSKGCCKVCYNTLGMIRKKKFGVDYKGGKCVKCGYDKYIGSLEFHHIDPEDKHPNFARLTTWSYDRIKTELDKCILLCANCHREEHNNIRQNNIDN